MRCQLLLLFPVVCLVLAGIASAGNGEQKGEAKAGWAGVFPEMNGYQRTFQAPVVGEGKTSYRQTARYEWTGGAVKLLEVTAARDPAFKQKYSAEALKKEKPAPKEMPVGKRKAWLWMLAKEGEGGLDKPYARLVVPLGEDKALIMELKGVGPWEPMADIVARFDLARVEAALAEPPK